MKICYGGLSSKIFKGVLGLIYPPRCRICGSTLDIFDDEVICEICHDNIKLNYPPFCKKCGRSGSYESGVCEECGMKKYYFDANYSACIYEGVIRECIHRFKYNSEFALEGLFKDLIADFADRYIEMEEYDWLVSVPLHSVKYRERTFNQSAVLAGHLSKRFRIPILRNNLIRIRPGKPQMTLSKKKRFEEIKNSFVVKNSSPVTGKSLLLIDDVFTTGATVNECSKVLRESGASSVEVLTLAKSE